MKKQKNKLKIFPEFILHRCNTLQEIKNASIDYGLEIDIRSKNTSLILHHDPFSKGVLFENWLKFYKHKTLILNVKEEGLEEAIMKMLSKHKIHNYFFLDQSTPSLVAFRKSNKNKSAVRYSEVEPITFARNFTRKISWVWVDSFSCKPPSIRDLKDLKKMQYKICLVSPELHGLKMVNKIPNFLKTLLPHLGLIDAICTKCPDKWINLLSESANYEL